jgi:hypothetical protein
MPFPEPETTLASMIKSADEGKVVCGIGARPAASQKALRHFNNLHEGSITCRDFQSLGGNA